VTQDDFLTLLEARAGHFLLESGHHGDLWLDLDALFLRPHRVHPFVEALAEQLAARQVDLICGPLTGGAFLAYVIAAQLRLEFAYTERSPAPDQAGLYTARYRLPPGMETTVRGKSIAIVDDVINAGSAARGTYHALIAAGARPTAVGALLVLGSAAPTFFSPLGVPLLSIARRDNALWTPEECPLCAAQMPLERVASGGER
jgi:orotate phosphoribosyltransferase